MAEPRKCPKCNTELSCRNRLITENCGHSKCRQCLISEENGCMECKQQNQQPPQDTPNIKEKIDIIEDKCLHPNPTNVNLRDKPKIGRTTFPAHIFKESVDNKVVYLCTFCNKRFHSRTQQYYHLFCNNSSKKPYKCEQCPKTFSSSSHLKYHMDGHSQKSFSCSICTKTFSKLQILRKHEKLHTAVAQQCSECGVKLKNKVAYTAHLQKHKNIFPFCCNVCNKKFSLKSTLRMHITIHAGLKQFKCDQCDKKFDRKSTLNLHTLRHSKQKNYSCSECSKQFIDMKSLMRHSKIHIGKSKYKCTLCETTSIRKDNITRHIRNMHPNDDKNSIEIISAESDNTKNKKSNEDIPQQYCNVTTNYSVDVVESDVPKTVANSSVIRCIGNVQPVIIPQENQLQTDSKVNENEMQPVIHPATTTHKKLKKKYNPCEIYRKILLDDDSTQENDKNCIGESTSSTVDQTKLVQETTVLYNGQQSNFSETHWRKNFKYTYQIQFD